MSQPDLELKKAFSELQQKMIETQQKVKISDVQIESMKRSIQHSKLTDKEIATLPKETRVYESVGRMFLLSDIDEVRNNLSSKQKTLDNKIKALESNKVYMEKSMKESEANLRELIVQKQRDANSS